MWTWAPDQPEGKVLPAKDVQIVLEGESISQPWGMRPLHWQEWQQGYNQLWVQG